MGRESAGGAESTWRYADNFLRSVAWICSTRRYRNTTSTRGGPWRAAESDFVLRDRRYATA